MEMSKRQEYQLDEYLDEVSINIYLLEWDGWAQESGLYLSANGYDKWCLKVKLSFNDAMMPLPWFWDRKSVV